MAKDEWLYRKVGRAYKKTKLFKGFPADGVWYVETKEHIGCTSTRIMRVGEIPDPMPLAGLMTMERECLAWMREHMHLLEKNFSTASMFSFVCKAIAYVESERRGLDTKETSDVDND